MTVKREFIDANGGTYGIYITSDGLEIWGDSQGRMFIEKFIEIKNGKIYWQNSSINDETKRFCQKFVDDEIIYVNATIPKKYWFICQYEEYEKIIETTSIEDCKDIFRLEIFADKYRNKGISPSDIDIDKSKFLIGKI